MKPSKDFFTKRERDALATHKKDLYRIPCDMCSKEYFVFRDAATKEDPIRECAMCEKRRVDSGHLDTWQTAAMLRGK